MEFKVSLTGHEADAAVHKRAVALLMAMEQEFANLKVEVADVEASPKKTRAKAGKDG